MCPKCEGMGNLVSFPGGRAKWLVCNDCGGSGSIEIHSPPTIRIHGMKGIAAKAKKMRDYDANKPKNSCGVGKKRTI
jgi:DnaJ-class molecular chaperone